MKKLIFLFVLATTTVTLNTSCGSNDANTEATAKVYYCPMECEGEKTYSEEGTCPVCEMDLVEKE
jgi:protein SCO1/2